ncbi:hypothetical protein CNMCM7691_004259 [Aspergillus felis]|uniref:Uncharacterized protein n=1 Tax=Aspergillus felis TaxID=1287682 RepID=A0A8H6VAS0_9EURO|nr:hypothetical protein CNMCM7691_004259 [Aspergillus felis]
MSGSNSSHLSAQQYGYDAVVSTTQESINAVMKRYLATNKQPEVCCCFVDKDGAETQVSLDEVLSKSNNTNPFEIPDKTDLNDERIKKLDDARFIRGWRARLGIPPMSDRSKLPNLVDIGFSNEAVNFYMPCAEFQVVSYIAGTRFGGKAYWLNVSQQKDKPWIFRSRVDIARQTVDPKKNPDKVPTDVRNALEVLEKKAPMTEFKIEQLLLDLENAGLMDEGGQLEGIRNPSPEYTMLKETFLGSYFDQMRTNGEPLLSCTINGPAQDKPVAESTLHITDFRYNLSPYLGPDGEPVGDPTPNQKMVATLNYLCAANGNHLPPRNPFTWNWVDVSELDKYHGTIAVRRDCLAEYLSSKLASQVLPNCIKPTFKFWRESVFRDWKASWDFSKTAADVKPTILAEGEKVLRIEWSSPKHTDEAKGLGILWATVQAQYTLDVEFKGNSNSILLTHHFVFKLEAKRGFSWGKADIVDHSRTDTYEIAVNDRGKLEAKCAPGPLIDASKDFETNLPDLVFSGQSTVGWVREQLSGKVRMEAFEPKQIPLSFVQDYVFPGGKSFTFKDVVFSKYQDLVSHLTYLDR